MAAARNPWNRVRPGAVTARPAGHPAVVVGVVDGSVDLGHPGLALQSVRVIGAGADPEPVEPRPWPGHGTLVPAAVGGRPPAPV
ncbi:hypothetical protein ACFW15_13100, partial [Streptomyces sp. NPDC058953]